jgi:uncharacterized protein YidB (DUF937 family)
MPVLSDITSKLGGKQGQDGGLASLQRMFNSAGGLQGMTSKLTNSGLGKQVQSWVGTGTNEPVTGTQVRQAVDPDHLGAMAEQASLTPEETSEHVAQALPEMVDQATPRGQMPDTDPFTKGLDSVKKMLKL